VPPDFATLLLARRYRADLLVLPRRMASSQWSDNGEDHGSTYDAFDLRAMRMLRASGVSIDALHDEPQRRLARARQSRRVVV
jgi:hypothetical protein